MSSETAAVAATTSKAVGKPKKPANKSKPKHPSYLEMVEEAIKHYNERSGSSRAAVLNYIINTHHIERSKTANNSLNKALKSGVESGAFIRTKGTGVVGYFKMGDGVAKKERKSATKKPVAEKKKTTTTASAKKPAKPKVAAAATSEPKKRGRPSGGSKKQGATKAKAATES